MTDDNSTEDNNNVTSIFKKRKTKAAKNSDTVSQIEAGLMLSEDLTVTIEVYLSAGVEVSLIASILGNRLASYLNACVDNKEIVWEVIKKHVESKLSENTRF